MTGTSGELSARPQERPLARPSALRRFLLVTSLVLGGILFGGGAASLAGTYSSTALVEAGPVVLGGVDATTSADNYVRTELAYISLYGTDMAGASEEAVGKPTTPVTVQREPGTTILSFNTNGASAADAALIANTSAQYYVDRWRTRTLSSLNKSIEILDQQIADLPKGSTDVATLESQRTVINTQISSVQVAERLISQATPETAAQPVSTFGGAVLGAFVGLAAGLALLLTVTRRRSSGSPRYGTAPYE